MTLSAGSRLGPYEIVSPLGAGGMGEVYKARDPKLQRDVAIKVLPESLAGDADALSRFEREALAVAALSHPNILAIHDFGRHEGVAYAVMELLEGDTLREKLGAGPIPRNRAVDYALQVVRGLSSAHEKGIVHRDLKPENVFITREGHVKILDFGLAKRVGVIPAGSETSAQTVSGRTEPGTVMGTVGYMSPEQVRGLPVDHRSDIFSFGTVLYEMLSGTRAFQRATAADTMSAILREEPAELSRSRGNMSLSLDRVVRHCLEKDPDDRFQSARDVEFALSAVSSQAGGAGIAEARAAPRRAVVAAAAIAILVAAAALVLWRSRETVGSGSVKRIAVLPFENLGTPEDDYFAEGMADEIRGKLTSLPGIEVIARGSSTPYKKTTKTPKQIGRELEAQYLLTATVRWQKSGGTSRVLVTPELVEVKSSGAPASRWQQPFDARLTNVFEVQSDIATQVAQQLGVALGAGEEMHLGERPTRSLAAYDSFLKGEEALKSGDVGEFRKAVTFDEQAVALDPAFARAWASLSLANSRLYNESHPTPDREKRAREAAERAMTLAPDGAEGYFALGSYQWLIALNHERALELFEAGQRLAPGNADLLWGRGANEVHLGRWLKAVEHYRQAERLDPRSPWVKVYLAGALLRLHRYSEARETLELGLRLAPANLELVGFKAMTFLSDQGDLAAARAVLEAASRKIDTTTLVAFLGRFWDIAWILDQREQEILLRLTAGAFDDNRATWGITLAQVCSVNGEQAQTRMYAEEARRAILDDLRVTPEDSPSRALLGLALAYLGQKEEAIREGQRAVGSLAVKSGWLGPYVQHQLVRIYILVGEPEKAIDELEPLLRVPYFLTPAWLKIDPNFDPLRESPRFQKLVATKV